MRPFLLPSFPHHRNCASQPWNYLALGFVNNGKYFGSFGEKHKRILIYNKKNPPIRYFWEVPKESKRQPKLKLSLVSNIACLLIYAALKILHTRNFRLLFNMASSEFFSPRFLCKT